MRWVTFNLGTDTHCLLGTAALVATQYPELGARHEWTLALAGTLRKSALSHAETHRLVEVVANYLGDLKVKDRLREVTTPSRGA